MSDTAVAHLLDAPARLYLINPNQKLAYGRSTLESLDAIGEPVDAVLSLVSAARSVEVVAEAARLDCGGVVVAASGFAESSGAVGAQLQQELRRTAGAYGLPVCGPNCAGFANIDIGGRRRNPGTAAVGADGRRVRS